MTTERGRLVVISGPSGVGKTAIQDALLDRYECERCVTATTRAPRTGEVDGVDYWFYDDGRFTAEIENDRFLEHAEVHGRRYGTPRKEVEDRLSRGATVVLNIDVQGARTLRQNGVEALFVFIEPPSFDVLVDRLRGRGTDDGAALQRRLDAAKNEMAARFDYDQRVVNDVFEVAVGEVASLIPLEERNLA